LNERRRVQIFYHTASRNTRAWREVEPHHLHLSGGDWYLIAHDDKRDEIRTFHLSRIEQFKILEQRFARRKDFDVNQWLRETFATEASAREAEVVIRFDAAQAVYIRERIYHPGQQIEELDNGALILRFRTSGLGAVRRWVMQYGASAEVLKPKSLRREVAQETRRMTEIYQEYSEK
jgi:predicted DNA-binding transcriptional regulator YafY